MNERDPSSSEAEGEVAASREEAEPKARPVRRATATRKSLLEDDAASVGAAWARALCESMRREGRLIEGGWPGTVVEARARVAGCLADTLARRKMSPLTGDELTAASDVAYARARQHWLVVSRQSKLAARHAGTSE